MHVGHLVIAQFTMQTGFHHAVSLLVLLLRFGFLPFAFLKHREVGSILLLFVSFELLLRAIDEVAWPLTKNGGVACHCLAQCWKHILKSLRRRLLADISGNLVEKRQYCT